MGAIGLRSGKCGNCKGNACETGGKNDLCFLGSANCWKTEYTCGSPLVGRGEGVLGKCVAKPTTKKRLLKGSGALHSGEEQHQ